MPAIYGRSITFYMSMQYTVIVHGCQNDNYQMKKYDIFIIGKNIEYGYKLEPSEKKEENHLFAQYTPILLYKRGFKGVKITKPLLSNIRACKCLLTFEICNL